MGKILYIRVDSSPLPEESDEIVVKNFNLESYFCTLLGKRLLEEAGMSGTMLYPGKLITDFEKFDKEGYREIIRQWEAVLSLMLISQSENDKYFIFKFPDSYIRWLDNVDVFQSSPVRDRHAISEGITIQRKHLFKIINEVLKSKLTILLQKNIGIFSNIVFSIDGINKECYIVHLWKQILKREYGLWTLSDFKKYCLFHIRPFRNNYEDAQSFSEGFAAIKRNGKWGYINKSCNEVIECKYTEVCPFHEGMACVKEENWGAINSQGDVKIPTSFQECHGYFSDGICAFNTVKNCGLWRYYNKDGKTVYGGYMDKAGYFSEGLVVIKGSDGYYIYDKNMHPLFYTEKGLSVYNEFHDGLIQYEEYCWDTYRYKYGFINNIGQIKIPCIYDQVSNFSEGLCFVKKNNYWGAIDKNGSIVIQFIFDYISLINFQEGLAAVKKDDKWGFVNSKGEVAIPFIYDDYHFGYRFVNGFAAVKFNGYWGFVDKSGKTTVPFIYEQWSAYENESIFSDSMAAVKKGGKWGYVNVEGKVVVPFIYDSVKPFFNGMACVSLNGKFGYLNKDWLNEL